MILEKQNFFKIVKQKIKFFIFDTMVKEGNPIFVISNDSLSLKYQLEGEYEKYITFLTEYYSGKGFKNFFIDIGANIGISSCLGGKNFERIFCFEPNPFLVNVLKANLELFFPNQDYEVFNYGLGDEIGKFETFIPKKNWGGAFINSKKNSYSQNILLEKDNFKTFDPKNFLTTEVEIRSTQEVLKNLFNTFDTDKPNKGVIKIDVEGFEPLVLEGISKSLPKNFSVIIFFENWNESLSFEYLKKTFKNRNIKIYKIESSILDKSISRFWKVLLLFIGFKNYVYYRPVDKQRSTRGDIVLEIS